jgi:hypothetical protein
MSMLPSAPGIDPITEILARHSMPAIGALTDEIAGTYRRIADLLAVRHDRHPVSGSAANAAVHSELGALAMAAGDQISVREHFLTATRLAATRDDLAAMMEIDAQLALPPGSDAVYAIYDLSKGPITYDFTHFLMIAERFRQLAGRTGIYVIFVPGAGDGFRHATERDHFLDRDRKLWRLANLLAPCAMLLPRCVGTTICATREEAAALLRTLPQDYIFPGQYSIDAPICPYTMPIVQQQAKLSSIDIRAFRAPPLAAELVRRWFAEIAGTKPVVSITLRQSDFQPARNSNAHAWRHFAEFCIAEGFHPVFIPDTEALLAGHPTGFEDFCVLDLPALSVGYRMAVYQESFVNAMVNNGPYGLCAYHPDARYLVFKVLNPAVATCTAAFLSAQGIPPNRQLPFAGPHQKLVWQFDEPGAITTAFTQMVQAVLAEPRPEPARATG